MCIEGKKLRILFYLVIVLSEGNHTRFELLSKTFLTFQCDETYPPPVCLWACKERYNLYMNRASLDLESVGCVS